MKMIKFLGGSQDKKKLLQSVKTLRTITNEDVQRKSLNTIKDQYQSNKKTIMIEGMMDLFLCFENLTDTSSDILEFIIKILSDPEIPQSPRIQEVILEQITQSFKEHKFYSRTFKSKETFILFDSLQILNRVIKIESEIEPSSILTSSMIKDFLKDEEAIDKIIELFISRGEEYIRTQCIEIINQLLQRDSSNSLGTKITNPSFAITLLTCINLMISQFGTSEAISLKDYFEVGGQLFAMSPNLGNVSEDFNIPKIFEGFTESLPELGILEALKGINPETSFKEDQIKIRNFESMVNFMICCYLGYNFIKNSVEDFLGIMLNLESNSHLILNPFKISSEILEILFNAALEPILSPEYDFLQNKIRLFLSILIWREPGQGMMTGGLVFESEGEDALDPLDILIISCIKLKEPFICQTNLLLIQSLIVSSEETAIRFISKFATKQQSPAKLEEFLNSIDKIVYSGKKKIKPEEIGHMMFIKYQFFENLLICVFKYPSSAQILLSLPAQSNKKDSPKIFFNTLLTTLEMSAKSLSKFEIDFLSEKDLRRLINSYEDTGSKSIIQYVILNTICICELVYTLLDSKAFSYEQLGELSEPLDSLLNLSSTQLTKIKVKTSKKFHDLFSLDRIIFGIVKLGSIIGSNDMKEKYEGLKEKYKLIDADSKDVEVFSEGEFTRFNSLISRKQKSISILSRFLSFGKKKQWLSSQFLIIYTKVKRTYFQNVQLHSHTSDPQSSHTVLGPVLLSPNSEITNEFTAEMESKYSKQITLYKIKLQESEEEIQRKEEQINQLKRIIRELETKLLEQEEHFQSEILEREKKRLGECRALVSASILLEDEVQKLKVQNKSLQEKNAVLHTEIAIREQEHNKVNKLDHTNYSKKESDEIKLIKEEVKQYFKLKLEMEKQTQHTNILLQKNQGLEKEILELYEIIGEKYSSKPSFLQFANFQQIPITQAHPLKEELSISITKNQIQNSMEQLTENNSKTTSKNSEIHDPNLIPNK